MPEFFVADSMRPRDVDTVDMIEKADGEAFFVETDVSRSEDVQEMVNATIN
jgi:hypothetical protein